MQGNQTEVNICSPKIFLELKFFWTKTFLDLKMLNENFDENRNAAHPTPPRSAIPHRRYIFNEDKFQRTFMH